MSTARSRCLAVLAQPRRRVSALLYDAEAQLSARFPPLRLLQPDMILPRGTPVQLRSGVGSLLQPESAWTHQCSHTRKCIKALQSACFEARKTGFALGLLHSAEFARRLGGACRQRWGRSTGELPAQRKSRCASLIAEAAAPIIVAGTRSSVTVVC